MLACVYTHKYIRTYTYVYTHIDVFMLFIVDLFKDVIHIPVVPVYT